MAPRKPTELIGNKAAAAYVGLSSDTWRPYVSRGVAPQPDRREVMRGFAYPVWRRATLDAWIKARKVRAGRIGQKGRPA